MPKTVNLWTHYNRIRFNIENTFLYKLIREIQLLAAFLFPLVHWNLQARAPIQLYEKIILSKFISNVFRRRKPALCAYITSYLHLLHFENKYDKSKLETEEHVDDYFTLYYVRQFHWRRSSGMVGHPTQN